MNRYAVQMFDTIRGAYVNRATAPTLSDAVQKGDTYCTEPCDELDIVIADREQSVIITLYAAKLLLDQFNNLNSSKLTGY